MTDDLKVPQMLRSLSTYTDKKSFKGHVVLFYAPQMKELAEKMCLLSDGKIVLGDISWQRFPDKFPNLHVQSAGSIKWAHAAFLGSLHSPEVILEQMAIMYALPRHHAKSMKVMIPYFSTGTMERVAEAGDIATAHTLARMLSNIPLSAGGPAQLCIMDIHTLQNQFYFGDTILPALRTAIPLLLKEMREHADHDKFAVAFPDEGADKRFGKLFAEYPIIICTKIRKGDKRIVSLKEGDVQGKHVVIVDDLVQSGGTLINCSKVLFENGADAVSAWCTHAIFPNESFKRILHTDEKQGAGNFSNFWVTDSHPTSQLIDGKAPFKVISAAPILTDFVCDVGMEDY